MNRQQRRAAERQAKPAIGTRAIAVDQAFAMAGQLHQAGRLAEAENACRQVLRLAPRHAPALQLLGIINLQSGRPDIAFDFISRAIAVDDQHAPFHNNLGTALRALGRITEAESSFRRALDLKPDYPKALSNLGQLLSATDPRAAADFLRQSLALSPQDLESRWSLAVVQHQQGALDEAHVLYLQVLEAAPAAVEAHENLAAVLLAMGRFQEAMASLRRVIELRPASPDAWMHVGSVLQREVRLSEAAEAYRQAILHKPDLAQAHNALGNVLASLGRLDESIAAYRRAITLDPNHSDARSNLLMTMHSHADVSAADILAEARRYGARLTARPSGSFANTPEPDRRLRIGYVSADFREHPVGVFLDRVLPAHDRANVETYLYSDTLFPDEQTGRLRAAADHWRPISGLPHVEAARMIEADGIDILIDLAGHTGSNRLPMFGARAAPVQVSWLGYFGTTGVGAIDHLLADAVVLPLSDAAAYTERVHHLPAPYLCWSPPALDLPVAPVPALRNGHVTFGCFNNRAKITPQTLDAWARILQRTPGSRLILKAYSLADAACRAALIEAFDARGVDGGRLILEGFSPRAEGLAAYDRIDIALDPFPFGGCTTTADTLWMGVPLVTLAGSRWSGRMSTTILASLGLDDWVAPDAEAYIDTAVRLAEGVTDLASVRAGLRARLEASAFCDGERFAGNLEDALRTLWRGWCAARTDG